MKQQDQGNLLNNTVNKLGRRSFVKGAGLTGLGLAGAAFSSARLGMLDNMPGAKTMGLQSSGVHAAGDINFEVGNFALNLEYLEAEFYTIATTGKRLEDIGIGTDGVGTKGDTIGGGKVNFEHEDNNDGSKNEVSGMLNQIAKEIAYDEQQHVILLRELLGDQAIAKPAINLDALGIGFATFKQFLQLARAFEDTGVSAYGGAAPLLTDKTALAYAVRIGLTEALHSANLRLLIAENHVHTMKIDGKDVLPPPSGDQYFEVDRQALAIVRTTSEVLSIVYGSSAPGTSRGGFFPNGVNGAITTV